MGNQLEKGADDAKKKDPEPVKPAEHVQTVGPGLRKMNALLQGGSPDAHEAAKILKQYPDERAQLLEAMQKSAGNSFASHVLSIERDDAAKPKAGINDAGAGVTVGNWQIGVKPAMSTDDRFDNDENRRKADQKDQNDRDAKARGEENPNPVMDLIKPKPKQIQPAPEVDQAIQDARDQINGVKKEPLEIDPQTLLPVVPGMKKKKPGLGFE